MPKNTSKFTAGSRRKLTCVVTRAYLAIRHPQHVMRRNSKMHSQRKQGHCNSCQSLLSRNMANCMRTII